MRTCVSSAPAPCDNCIAFHIKAALGRGATRDEILETLSVAVYMGGGPSVMYGATRSLPFGGFPPRQKRAERPGGEKAEIKRYAAG